MHRCVYHRDTCYSSRCRDIKKPDLDDNDRVMLNFMRKLHRYGESGCFFEQYALTLKIIISDIQCKQIKVPGEAYGSYLEYNKMSMRSFACTTNIKIMLFVFYLCTMNMVEFYIARRVTICSLIWRRVVHLFSLMTWCVLCVWTRNDNWLKLAHMISPSVNFSILVCWPCKQHPDQY